MLGEAKTTIRFSLNEFLCPQRCYDFLLKVLHPNGLRITCSAPSTVRRRLEAHVKRKWPA